MPTRRSSIDSKSRESVWTTDGAVAFDQAPTKACRQARDAPRPVASIAMANSAVQGAVARAPERPYSPVRIVVIAAGRRRCGAGLLIIGLLEYR